MSDHPFRFVPPAPTSRATAPSTRDGHPLRSVPTSSWTPKLDRGSRAPFRAGRQARSRATAWIALALLHAIVLVFASGCGGPTMPDRTVAERRAEAKRLRANLPGTVTLPSPADDGEASNGNDAANDAPPTKESDTAATPPAADPDAPFERLDFGTPDALVLGEFQLVGDRAIVDGDTVKVEGLDASLRLLGIDTEETFKKDENRQAALADFDAYAAAQRGDSAFPVKYGTPMGMEALEWAESFFDGVSTVRLELDELGRQRGVFGRYLVYVFVKRGGEWVNYNVEAVRAGMTPYFSKYGYSRRFHDEFVQAQSEAQFAERGIWNDSKDRYPDYEERLAWWNRRGDAIRTFEAAHWDDPSYFLLGLDSEWDRMSEYVGQSVTVFGTINQIKLDESPYLVRISHKRFNDFTIVAFDMAEMDALGIEQYDGEFFYVKGVLSTYRDKYQFKAQDVESIWVE